MIILKEQVGSQTFKVIPRSYTADSFDIIGLEGTTNYLVTPVRQDYSGNTDSEGTYLSLSKIITIKEGQQYKFVLKNGTDVVYEDTIFCTNQTIGNGDFSINDAEYTENTTDNDYVIYE
jgi:hypothetical protein